MNNIQEILKSLHLDQALYGASTGLESWAGKGLRLESFSPVDGKTIASLTMATQEDYEKVIQKAQEAFPVWSQMPAPKRGEIIRRMGNALREYKDALGRLVSYEMGKSLQEGWGEVQEMIDICDFAVGLSRQLYGLSMHSERPRHRMYEQWHPLGIVGIISAFNFPVAVWSWNSMIAWACGNVCIWKPSEKTPLTALACQHILQNILRENNLPEGLSCLIIGDRKIGELMAQDPRVPLISATGSTRMGKAVGEAVAKRLGRSILELGGNNAIIVSDQADLKQALPAIVFGAVGTAGQRCTTTRRVIIQENIYEEVKNKLAEIYSQLRIGDPLQIKNHLGPLIDIQAVQNYLHAIEEALAQGAKLIFGGQVLQGEGYESGCYVQPTLMEAQANMEIVQKETFAPILYLIRYSTLEEAIQIQNNVPQGLSSAIFTLNMREAETFLAAAGSDCGIANVNIGTSGAEIGGAFGGEKETGGGRESGSDAWKAYMRRQTCTLNWGQDLPLAQGIKFEV